MLDFGQFYPGNDATKEAELCTRIITSPADAKNLLDTLRESIDRYEQHFGNILDENGLLE